MATTIRIGLYTNGDDAFVAWKPSAFIEDCRGFMLERQRKTAGVAQPVENVENRVGFKKDKPKSGDHRTVGYLAVPALQLDRPRRRHRQQRALPRHGDDVRGQEQAVRERRVERMDRMDDAGDRLRRRRLVLLQSRPRAVAVRRALHARQASLGRQVQGEPEGQRRSRVPRVPRRRSRHPHPRNARGRGCRQDRPACGALRARR